MCKQLTTKILALLLCVAMMLSITACGSSTPETTPATEKAEAPETSTQAPTESAKREETVSLTLEVFDRGNMSEEYGTPTSNFWVDMIHDKVMEELNIDLQYVAIPRSEEVTKIQALMAANSEPDIFYTYSLDQAVRWADEEVLADMTPYMEYGAGKELADAMGEQVMSFGVINGKQYAVNAVRYDQGMYSCFIRKDLLDQVGVELGELNGHYAITPSQLKDALVKIKEGGFCEYPFGMYNMHDARCAIEGAFISADSNEDLAKGMSGSYFTIDEAGDKEAFRYLNDCYNSGLINPDFPLFNATNIEEIIATGQTAFWAVSYWCFPDGLDAFYEVNPDAELVAVELTHEDGTPAVYEKYAPIGAYGMVSSSCENVEAAVELINWLMTSEDAHMIIHHGIEGENFEYQDGRMVPIQSENAHERKSVGDLDVLMNYDPCTKDPDLFAAITREKNAAHDSRVVEMMLDGQKISISEGKFVIPAINNTVNASIDFAAELNENSDNLWIGSVTAPADKFDEVYDNYFQVFMKEGGEQRAQERLDIYLESQK